MKIVYLILLSFFLAAGSAVFPQDDGKLKRMEEEAKKKDEKKEEGDNEKTRERRQENNSGSEESYGGSCVESVFTDLILQPEFWAFLESVFLPPPPSDSLYWQTGFTDYPYSDHSSGEFRYDSRRASAFIAEAAYVSESGNLNGIVLKGRFSFHPLWNLEFDASRFYERLFRSSYGLSFYNVFINMNRGRSESHSFRYGLGLKIMSGTEVNTGPALNTALELYILYPASIILNYNIGIINRAAVSEFYAGVGFHAGRIRVSGGYQAYSVNAITINSVSMGMGVYF